MESTCACKGIRTCLLCESSKAQIFDAKEQERVLYFYCPTCQQAHRDQKLHPDHGEDCLNFPGVQIIQDFVSEEEEKHIVEEIYKVPWIVSQSGRRKQDYGPKVNFKKKKLKTSVFTGLPHFSAPLMERLKRMPNFENFIPVEQCNLEYTPERGSAIDPHFDDFWLWGERLITLNLLSPTHLNMTRDDLPNVEVDITLPRRSLIILSGAARYEWKHGIHRKHIMGTRLAVTYREFTPEFLAGGPQETIGKEVIDVALTYQGKAVGS